MPIDNDFKTRFLLTALPDIPFDGWTDTMMRRAGETLGASDAKVAAAFPKGARDLAVYFSDWATEEALKNIDKKMVSLRVREKIFESVKARLDVLAPHKQALSSALAFLAVPPHAFVVPGMVWRAVDRIWWAAGDTATDYNHYTKRVLLSGIITTTTLYWINDTSKGHAKTWAFLERRINNVLKISQAIGKLKSRATSNSAPQKPRQKSKSKRA